MIYNFTGDVEYVDQLRLRQKKTEVGIFKSWFLIAFVTLNRYFVKQNTTNYIKYFTRSKIKGFIDTSGHSDK